MAVTEADLAAVEAGLDALERHEATRGRRWRRLARGAVPPLVAVAILIGLWQLAVALRLKPPVLLPAPLDVARSFWDQLTGGTVGQVLATSLGRAAVGYAIALAVGTALGCAMSSWRPLRAAIGPLVSSLQSLPSVAWVPFGILWFGLSEWAIYFVVIMGAFPSIANGLVAAVDQIPPLLLRVGDVMGARGLDRLRHVVLPAALPGYIAGLRQAWSFSWRSLMAAELIAAGPELGLGLGQFLRTGQDLLDMSLVLTAVGLILVVGILVETLVFGPLDRGVRRRRGLTGA